MMRLRDVAIPLSRLVNTLDELSPSQRSISHLDQKEWTEYRRFRSEGRNHVVSFDLAKLPPAARASYLRKRQELPQRLAALIAAAQAAAKLRARRAAPPESPPST